MLPNTPANRWWGSLDVIMNGLYCQHSDRRALPKKHSSPTRDRFLNQLTNVQLVTLERSFERSLSLSLRSLPDRSDPILGLG